MGEELWQAQGNDQADKYATKGREIHENEDKVKDKISDLVHKHKEYLRHVGRALAVWAKQPKEKVEWAKQNLASTRPVKDMINM